MVTSLYGAVVCKRNLVDIVCRIRQVAACVAKLVLLGAFGILGEGEALRGQQWYHSKER